MRVQDELRYPADPATVFAMFCHPDFQEQVCEANGATSYDVDVRETADGGAVIRTERVLPTDTVPDFVRSFVGATLRVTEVDEWQPAGADGARQGTATVHIDGAPVRLTASLRLEADGSGNGSVQRLDGELKASVPLIGGKVEKAAEPAVRAAIRAQGRAAGAWLDQD
jgi:hypothetical protein